jgi:hypothetical protein
MATWTDVSSTVLEPGDPIRSVDIIAIKENIIALSEGASGAPKILDAAITEGLTANTIYRPLGLAFRTVTPSGTGYVIRAQAYLFRSGIYNFEVYLFNNNIGNTNTSTITARIYRDGVAISSEVGTTRTTNTGATVTIPNVTLDSDGMVQIYVKNSGGNQNAVGVGLWAAGYNAAVKINPFGAAEALPAQ